MRNIASAGHLIRVNAPGGQSARITVPAGPWEYFPKIMHARGFIVGTKMDLRESATGTNSSALRWHCGTGVTKAAAHCALTIQPGETEVIRLRLAASEFRGENAFANFAKIFALRQREADEFYATLIPQDLSDDDQNLMRQVSLACCGPRVLPLCGQRLAGRWPRRPTCASGTPEGT